MFVVGSHCVFVTSSDLSINTIFKCFKLDTVSMNQENSDFLLPHVNSSSRWYGGADGGGIKEDPDHTGYTPGFRMKED